MDEKKDFPHKLYNDAQLQPAPEKKEEIETPEAEIPAEEETEKTEK